MRLLVALWVWGWVAYADPCAEKLSLHAQRVLKQSYVQSFWPKDFLGSLISPEAKHLDFLQELGIGTKQIHQLENRLNALLPRGVRGKASIVGISTAPKKKTAEATYETHAVILIRFYYRQKNIGFAGFTYAHDKRRQLYGQLTNFYKALEYPRQKLTEPTLRAMDEKIHLPMGLNILHLHADTLGRYHWARHGFQFRRGMWYRDANGVVVTLPEMARRNLRRFLKRHEIGVRELVLREGRKRIPVRSLLMLKQPSDYARLEHKDGKMIDTSPCIEKCEKEPVLGPQVAMPIGKAFLLADYRAFPGEESIRTAMRSRRSAFAMPDYRAVRIVRGN